MRDSPDPASALGAPPRRARRRRRDEGGPDGPLVVPFDIRGSGALNWLRWRRRWVSVGLGEGILYATPRPDRVLTFPVDGIRRILAGRESYRFATGHRLEIWPARGRSIILTAFEGYAEMPSYIALVRGLAIELERRGALDRMRIGLPRRYVFGLPLLIFVCLYGTIWYASWSEGHGPETVQEYLLLALGVLVLALVPTAAPLPQGFHRRVRTPADLDRFFGLAPGR